MELVQQMEAEYDPSDTDRAQQIACVVMQLMQQAQLAIDTKNAGMRIGRDNAIRMQSAIVELGRLLGLLPHFSSDAQSVNEFLSKLRR